jgi:hypothetical protein
MKDELHSLVEQLDEATADEALVYLHWLASESETLSDEELAAVHWGEEQIANGEYVTLAELRQTLAG